MQNQTHLSCPVVKPSSKERYYRAVWKVWCLEPIPGEKMYKVNTPHGIGSMEWYVVRDGKMSLLLLDLAQEQFPKKKVWKIIRDYRLHPLTIRKGKMKKCTPNKTWTRRKPLKEKVTPIPEIRSVIRIR